MFEPSGMDPRRSGPCARIVDQFVRSLLRKRKPKALEPKLSSPLAGASGDGGVP